MKGTDYRDILRDMQCCFCPTMGEGLVSWHHLLCLGLSGTALKAPDAFTIPVCAFCHNKGDVTCHNYKISRNTQKLALMATWQTVIMDLKGTKAYTELLSKFAAIDIQQIGRSKAWEAKGALFWEAIGGE